MNKKITLSILLVLILISLFSSPVLSQSAAAPKLKQPWVNIDLLFSFNQPMPNLYGNIADFFAFTSYGVKYGFGSQINVKVTANKKGTIKPYFTLGYNLFLGSDETTAYIDSNKISSVYPLPGSKRYGTVPGSSKMYMNDFYFGAGFEYDFVNKTRWTPYLGTDLNMNVLFGIYRQTAGNFPQTSYIIKPGVRFGFATVAGIYYRVTQALGFTFAAKYRFANVIGKSSDATNSTADLNKMNLLDDSAPGLNTYLTKSRNIDYFEFLLGISFFIGRR
jgi:hypothetical protein